MWSLIRSKDSAIDRVLEEASALTEPGVAFRCFVL